MRNFVWIRRDGAKLCTADDQEFEEIGLKAKGQLELPEAWVPPFAVVSPDLINDYRSAERKDRSKIVSGWCAVINAGIELAALDRESKLIIRSNALNETLRDRGRLSSAPIEAEALAPDLEKLLSQLIKASAGERIGLIVQKYIEPVLRGHLSNERRVKEEYRDGLIQFEQVSSGAIHEESIGYRHWRRRSPPSEQLLVCRRFPEIRAALREPLAFAAINRKRLNYEWVWNGAALYVVQADPEYEAERGVSPESLVGEPTIEPAIETLSVFRRADDSDRNKASKLNNHFRFQDAGFWQPTFYLLEDDEVLEGVVKGSVPDALKRDLKLLTESLFMIRTSCTTRSVQLLPRSHVLSTAQEAIDWLTGEFASELDNLGVEAREVILIAHHYVQALSSAFSMGSVDKQDVRIEASWGIPEGLYYNPCDTYVVNTLARDVEALSDDRSHFTLRTPSRGPKRHFVAPNPNNGQFERHRAAKPFDWKPTIGDQDTLSEMAAFTRRLAKERGHPVNLMWFVDCRTSDGDQKAIPWYSEPLEEQSIQKYRQNAKDVVFEVSTEKDLELLERGEIPHYSTTGPGKLVIDLNPTDNVALRDKNFAERVGAAAAIHDGLIILNGATLSHIYFTLQRSGAMVCSRQNKEIEADRESHRKLVRDNIPQVVESSGETAVISTLSEEEKQAALRVKLLEEAFEAKDASGDDLIGELADVQEVIRALGRAYGLSEEDVEKERAKKEANRGSFDDGIVLVETLTSAPETDITPDDPQQDLGLRADPDTSQPHVDLNMVGHGWRDIREDRDYSEIIETASVPLWHREWSIDSSGSYRLPDNLRGAHLTWDILGKREGSTLKLKIRIQFGGQQLTLDLGEFKG